MSLPYTISCTFSHQILVDAGLESLTAQTEDEMVACKNAALANNAYTRAMAEWDAKRNSAGISEEQKQVATAVSTL